MNEDRKTPRRTGADRRTYQGTGPRVGRVAANVPRARRVDAPETPAEENRWKDPKKRNEAARRAQPPEPAPNVREEAPEGVLWGRNPIREALRAGQPVEKLLVANGDLSSAAREIISMAKSAGVIVQYVDRKRLDDITPAHQGLIAYVAAAEYSTVEEMLAEAEQKGEPPLLVLLDGITDPHNLGAILRSAECVGAHGVVLTERRSCGLTATVAKSAAGALSYVKVARVTNLNRTIEDLKARGLWIIGTSMNGEDAMTADLSGPVALVIGAEGEGISPLTLKKCDRLVTLPMRGRIGSLNASVAAGVMLYAILRARLP